ncbi:MAG: hypothetical protein HYW02_06120 [Deltaproteobacteria bacterium]|nr:hypothetical protein [Deltaproteobacteria bacterium]
MIPFIFKRKVFLAGILLIGATSVTAGPSQPLSVDERLRRGEVVSEGGYEGALVWAKMIAAIEAPPSLVWQIFIDSDRWLSYEIPTLLDSRLVTPKITNQVGESKKVGHFYEILGRQSFSMRSQRLVGGEWGHDAFQFYDVPWPVKNRWMIIRVQDDETKSLTGLYRATMTKAAGNIKSLEAEMVLAPFEGDPRRTRFVYSVRTDPDAHVPKFLIRWGVKRVMPAVIRAIRQEAMKRKANRFP